MELDQPSDDALERPCWDQPHRALSALAGFAEALSKPDFDPGRFEEGQRNADGSCQLGYSQLSPSASQFVAAAYEGGWIQPFDCGTWRDGEEARQLLAMPHGVAQASLAQWSRVLTTVVRQDRSARACCSAGSRAA